MKKKVLLIAALFTAGLSFAQDGLTSKKGVPILPEAGDWAIGFDASSLLSYGGNLLNGAADNGLNSMGDINTNTIYGKYFVDANTAYRGMVRLGFETTNTREFVTDYSTGNINPSTGTLNNYDATVENEDKTSVMNITVGGGMEFRRGKGRLQGVYGPMAMISMGTSSTEYTYGVSIQDAFNNGDPNYTAGNGRITETKNGTTFGLTVGGFAGVEYFFAPKISLGAEIGWTIALNSTGDGEETYEDEVVNPLTGEAFGNVSTTYEFAGNSSFGFDTRPNGNITLNFHF